MNSFVSGWSSKCFELSDKSATEREGSVAMTKSSVPRRSIPKDGSEPVWEHLPTQDINTGDFVVLCPQKRLAHGDALPGVARRRSFSKLGRRCKDTGATRGKKSLD